MKHIYCADDLLPIFVFYSIISRCKSLKDLSLLGLKLTYGTQFMVVERNVKMLIQILEDEFRVSNRFWGMQRIQGKDLMEVLFGICHFEIGVNQYRE